MNNIEHLVHPGVIRNLDKAKATLELAKIAVELDPVDSRAHLCCGWSYAFALREAEAAPHMDLACELNDNDPWTLLSSAHYCAFCGSIEQAQLRASQSLALSLAPSRLEWGYHCIIHCLCGDYASAIEACDRANNVIQTLPAWRAAALFELGQPELAREEAQRFLNGIRSFWVGSDRRRPTWPSHAGFCKRTPSTSRCGGKPCAAACAAPGFRSKALRHCTGDKAARGLQAQALMV